LEREAQDLCGLKSSTTLFCTKKEELMKGRNLKDQLKGSNSPYLFEGGQVKRFKNALFMELK